MVDYVDAINFQQLKKTNNTAPQAPAAISPILIRFLAATCAVQTADVIFKILAVISMKNESNQIMVLLLQIDAIKYIKQRFFKENALMHVQLISEYIKQFLNHLERLID